MAIALSLAVVVALVTAGSQARVGAGVYYDDGVYLALGRALAEGHGYVYSNLPEPVPGVKYPPAYPITVAAAWKVLSSYPENLRALKGLNALFIGAAAAVTFLLFAEGGRRRLVILGLVTAFAYLTVPTLSVSTVLLSEPLFMLFCMLALLAAGRALGGARRLPGYPAGATTESVPVGGTGSALAAGLLAALGFLTRTVGLTLVATVVVALLLRRRFRAAALAGAAALIPSAAWVVWSSLRAGDVPGAIAGQYGAYGMWLSTGSGAESGAGPLRRFGEIATANWGPFIDTLEFVWIPRSPSIASGFILLVLAAAAVYGAARVARRNLALALFPAAYLILVFVWPYEPYRFFYAMLPILTLLVAEGLFEGLPRLRQDLPRWGLPVAVVAGGILGLNTLEYQVRGHVNRAWESSQTIPASAYAPLNNWIRTETEPGTIIASGLDPYIHWETGRPTLPSWEFLADDYGRYDRTPEVLSAGLDSILTRFRPAYVALVRGENKAAATLEAFAALHPERALKVFESEGVAFPGVIYRVAAPGEVIPPNPR